MTLEWESFYIGALCIALITSSIHLVGIALLCKTQSDLQNQTIIMINLSLTEMLFCINLCIPFIGKIALDEEEWDELKYLKSFNLGIDMSTFIVNKMVMLYLIIDRFLDIKLHMKYPLYFTKTRVTRILCLFWLLGAVYGGTQGTLFQQKIIPSKVAWRNHNFVSMSLDIVITVVTISTYAYFLYKVRSMLRIDQNNNSNHSNSKNKSAKRHYTSKFIIPFLILATYLVFNVTSSILFVLRRLPGSWSSSSLLLLQVAWLIETMGFLSDALLYIFLQRHVRTLLASKLRCILRFNDSVLNPTQETS